MFVIFNGFHIFGVYDSVDLYLIILTGDLALKIKIDIQRANQSHLIDIIKLNDEVQKLHALAYPDIFKYPLNPGETHDFFNQILNSASDDNHIFFARQENKTVGYIWANVVHKSENVFKFKRDYILIHQVLVTSGSRSQNVGSSLFNKIHQLAAELNISSIILDTWFFNKDAHAFFQKMGFEQYKINLWRKHKESK